MAEITAAVNGLVALCLRSTRTRAAQPDTRHLGSALEKVESAESSDSDSEFTEKHKRLPQQQQQQQQRWKRLRWTGWSRKEGLVVVKADSTARNRKPKMHSRVWQATELPLRHMEIAHPFL